MSESVGPEVVLLTRPGCHLCEDARLVLRRVGEDLGIPWQERSAEEDPELAARFGEEIPVLFIDGVQRDFWKIDETRLRRLLGS
ncbi:MULTISPECIES: glutaredoxin family protein [unclassified Arthrobacter]|uniref:glutaredoxin family protein n=1 Tax=unclassified Arthrobacter TaxID=235627 RepID=UPI002101F4AC|nr:MULTISPECIES: glutaredoxin family protein [unclassified Arthrobacter]MCQ1945783.1 glutaredoxin family protein [Arthrobacter sp. zg-Y1116]MCQ1985725.1 glutaredoxin family protein [Arthrobacter sp. zg-Y844]MCQ1994558.1 glutaredoxin family protein [Arthrobacter sp. zg-Y1171]UWX81360.1 glutaredoxin family protein [Arthrobacter sp. zg-Y1171]